MGHTTDRAPDVLAWGRVAEAVALVAGGRYPRVIVANIDNADRIAAALAPDALRCGVDLVVETGPDGTARDVVARRR